jgi:nicotinate-nucleotide adenylyltransferase
MRLGLFGGTFDPPHFAHLLIAEQCREQCGLDEVWFLPSGIPPHKRAAGITAGKQRAEMLELAVAGCPQLRVNRLELERTGTSYTFETLQQLRDEEASRALYFLIGTDSLVDLPGWREPGLILDLATVVAVNRGDRPVPDPSPLVRAVGEERASRIRHVAIPGIDFSSTDIRRRVREGRSIRFMVPRAVEMYIAENGLYRDARQAGSCGTP